MSILFLVEIRLFFIALQTETVRPIGFVYTKCTLKLFVSFHSYSCIFVIYRKAGAKINTINRIYISIALSISLQKQYQYYFCTEALS